MAGRTLLVVDIPVDQIADVLEQQLIAKYPTSILPEIEVELPCGMVIGIHKGGCLETPMAIIRGPYQEVRAVGTACQMAKGARIPFSSPVIAPATAEAI